jgi:hypothetical protein
MARYLVVVVGSSGKQVGVKEYGELLGPGSGEQLKNMAIYLVLVVGRKCGQVGVKNRTRRQPNHHV